MVDDIEQIQLDAQCNESSEDNDWTHLSLEDAQARIDACSSGPSDACELTEFGYNKDGKFQMSFIANVV